MELLIDAITLLRKKYNFNGYIHVKAIPGASNYLLKKLNNLNKVIFRLFILFKNIL